MKIETLYIDMDGVIADFSKRYKEKFRATPEETRSKGKKEFNEFFKKFIEDGEFSTLDLMPDAKELLHFVNQFDVNKEILSSTARPENHGMIAPQKQMWLNKHNIEFPVNLVPGKRFKRDFSNENSLLIDDTSQNIDQWRVEGGIGILHTDAMTTIGILKMYT
jgi:hypothetical protein